MDGAAELLDIQPGLGDDHRGRISDGKEVGGWRTDAHVRARIARPRASQLVRVGGGDRGRRGGGAGARRSAGGLRLVSHAPHPSVLGFLLEDGSCCCYSFTEVSLVVQTNLSLR